MLAVITLFNAGLCNSANSTYWKDTLSVLSLVLCQLFCILNFDVILTRLHKINANQVLPVILFLLYKSYFQICKSKTCIIKINGSE